MIKDVEIISLASMMFDRDLIGPVAGVLGVEVSGIGRTTRKESHV